MGERLLAEIEARLREGAGIIELAAERAKRSRLREVVHHTKER